MSAPLTPPAQADDPVTAWQHIVESRSGDPDLRARLDVVARFADATVAAAAGRGWLRPPAVSAADTGVVWAQVALAWYEVLTDAETLAAPDGPTVRCRADAAELRDWLHGPDTPAHATTGGDPDIAAPVAGATSTVADGLGLDDFDLYAFDKLARVTRLLAAAQDAGVFGVDGYRIEILHHAGDRGHVNEHRVMVSAPLRGTLCSPPVDTVELLSAHLSGVDAAVHVLTVIAAKVEQALDPRAVVADAIWPAPSRTAARPPQPAPHGAGKPVETAAPDSPPQDLVARARPFRPLAVDTQSVVVPAEAEPVAPSRNGRRR